MSSLGIERLIKNINNHIAICIDNIMDKIEQLVIEVKQLGYDEGYCDGYAQGKIDGNAEAQREFNKPETVEFT